MTPLSDQVLAFSLDPRLFEGHLRQPRWRTRRGLPVGLDEVLRQTVVSLLPALPELPPEEAAAVEGAVADFVAGQFDRMPRLLFAGSLVALSWIRVESWLRRSSDGDEGLRACARAWEASRIPGQPQFARLIRGCALFRFYDDVRVLAHLERAGTGAAA